MIKARHILETVLYAADLSAARRFYADVLGLPVYQEVDGRLVFFRCAGQMLLVFNPVLSAAQISAKGPPAHGMKGSGHVCFRGTLSELEEWQKHFAANDIAIERIVDWPEGGRSVYIRDPAGNSVEFAESRIWDLPELKTLRNQKIVVATHNQGKLREINELLSPHGVTAVSAGSLGFDEPEETESTFTGNAKLKAVYAAERSGLVALADDSGLCVDSLNGDPGVYTANWAGPDRDWAMAMRLVEEKLQAIGATTPDKRKAHFNCTLCVAWPHGEVQFFDGRVPGTLAWPPRGARGFGYDPMFIPDGETETFGEMDPARKTLMSHRGRAFGKLVDALLDAAFGIYVHWPFCKAKCPYCDFNSHVRHHDVNAMSFAKGLTAELKWFAGITPGRKVSSIFFGGGTPSLMPPAAVADVIDQIAQLWPIADTVEITLEANPTSVEAENFRGYRTAGVNRVSVGVQALNEADLRALGRQHTPDEALKAFRLAAKVFPRVSFDLIYARPQQTTEQWKGELTRALNEQEGHMSLYQLTIEPGTAYFDLHAKGALIVPDEDRATDLFELTQALTEKHGLSAYEVSNHAAPGQESRHNLLYWRYGEYVGVGPGAHARIAQGENRRAIAMEKYPETWRKLVNEKGHGIVEDNIVPPVDQASEYLIMGLRISEGIDLDRYEKLKGQPIDPNKIAGLKSLGLVKREGSRLMATTQGRRLLNALITELAQ